MRVLLSPAAIAVIDLLILIPLALSIVDVMQDLWTRPDIHEPMDIVEGMGVILIGWGVALEERAAMRGIFGLMDVPDPARQNHIDHVCHHTGIGLLVFGLFAEICVEAIRLPDRIIDTKGINHAILAVSVVFLAISAFIMVRHIAVLFGQMMHRH
jgi:multisubunit Na+/H+ antiporter MnhG subunit